MAQRVQTVIIDDLDGSEMDPSEATTVTWSWRGVSYELDTRSTHLTALESDRQSVTLGLLLASSRRVGGRAHSLKPVVDTDAHR
ncbi:MAG: Lsr2 family protein [Gordonia polyisoprenivorans]|nr:Lsr2 family protein [Gordonia polyisoprenivorans]